jgi:GH18 family chitinase
MHMIFKSRTNYILNVAITTNFTIGGREDSPGFPEDKENHAKLLREMRAAFDEHNFLLTAAVSAGFQTIDKAYDVPTMAETLDFINLMSYDYHGW